RHHLRRDGDRREARVALAPAVGDRDLRASRPEPARRAGDDVPARGDDAAARGHGMRRSLHFVPGGNERMMQKALGTAADGLILDLEDAVTPERKPATRPVVRRWLETLPWGAKERWVRMNPIESEYGLADIEETIAGRPTGYVVPKPRRAEDVRRIVAAVERLEARHPLPCGSPPPLAPPPPPPGGVARARGARPARPALPGAPGGRRAPRAGEGPPAPPRRGGALPRLSPPRPRDVRGGRGGGRRRGHRHGVHRHRRP